MTDKKSKINWKQLIFFLLLAFIGWQLYKPKPAPPPPSILTPKEQGYDKLIKIYRPKGVKSGEWFFCVITNSSEKVYAVQKGVVVELSDNPKIKEGVAIQLYKKRGEQPKFKCWVSDDFQEIDEGRGICQYKNL